jgi:phosphoribosyl-dephospho-CoA transferase
MELRRNQLVWISPQGWDMLAHQTVLPHAQEALQHWRTHQLPLVVASQRPDCPPGYISLGLPAPLQWGRVRLALQLPAPCITRSGKFPSLSKAAHAFGWSRQSRSFENAMAVLDIGVQVYGSHGWQLMTGLPYVRDSSDIDLHLQLPGTQVPPTLTELLAAQHWGRRLDGEIVFASGHALAWREWQQLQHQQVQAVLVKSRDTARLLAPQALQDLLLHDAVH